MSAREALERDTATWPVRQRWLLFGRRWPMRIAAALCVAVALVSDLPAQLNGAVVFAARVLLVVFVTWAALADAFEVLHFSINLPDSLPRWLAYPLDVWLAYPCRLGGALGCAIANVAPIFFGFPSLKGTAGAYCFAVLLAIGFAPSMLSALLALGAGVVVVPLAIPISIVRSIRNRHDRRYREIYRYVGHPPW